MNLLTLIKVSRPRFWLYTAGPVLVAMAFSGTITPLLVYAILWFALPGNVFLYGVNDLADTDTDRYNPKKGTKEHRHEREQTVSLIIAIAISIALLVPLLVLSNWKALMFFAGFVALGGSYSLPPIRFKARPGFDALSNVLYALPGLGAYALATGSWPSIAVCIAAGAWSAAMHWMSAIPDIEADTTAGLSTSATALGARGSLIGVAVLWTIALVSGWIAGLPLIIVLLGLVYPLMPIALIAAPDSVARVYWWYPLINALFGFSLFIAGVLTHV